MKLSILVAVVLRLFAINWGVACCIGMLGAVGVVGMYSSGGSLDGIQAGIQFAVPAAYGIFAILSWVLAGTVARRAVGAVDPELRFAEVGPENLYALGILGMGLYYALNNVAGTINWLHYIAANGAGQEIINGENNLSIYEVTSVMIPCAAGVAVAILSPKLGRKLAASIRSRPTPQAEQGGDGDA